MLTCSVCVCVNCSPELTPACLDDDKMTIDDEALKKLMEKFYEEHKFQQEMKNCEPQVMTHVTGECCCQLSALGRNLL